MSNSDSVSRASTAPSSHTPAPEAGSGTPGFFRVARDGSGRWTMVGPDGEPMVMCAVCGVNRAGTPGGRLAKDGPYAETIDRKYRYPGSPQAFVEAALDRLRAWNFNALGAWNTEEFFDQGLPFTEILECARLTPPLSGPGMKVPDVFDPEWTEAVERQAERLCTPLRESRDLVGYFTDNELGWGQPDQQVMWGAPEMLNRKGPTLLQGLLGLTEDRPARREAWRFLLERHGSLDGIAAAWGVALSRPEDLVTLTETGTILNTEGFGADQHDFSVRFAETYTRTIAEAIRRHDPNHMILGARFGGPPGPAILEGFRRPWVDVVSMNNYRPNMKDRLDLYVNGHDMPFLNGEFAWASPPFVDPDHWPEEDQARSESVEEHVRRVGPASLFEAFEHRQLVGYTWYRWVKATNQGMGYGLVDFQDDPHPFNVPLVTEVNAGLRARGRTD